MLRLRAPKDCRCVAPALARRRAGRTLAAARRQRRRTTARPVREPGTCRRPSRSSRRRSSRSSLELAGRRRRARQRSSSVTCRPTWWPSPNWNPPYIENRVSLDALPSSPSWLLSDRRYGSAATACWRGRHLPGVFGSPTCSACTPTLSACGAPKLGLGSLLRFWLRT